MTKKLIRGAGGGGGKAAGSSSVVAVEARDSLRSKAFARVLDMLGEGEIVGLVDGSKSIYLDETPLQNDDGSYNFTGVQTYTRTGTQAQSYIPGFPSIESETAVGVEVKASSSVTRQITNSSVDAVRVRVSVPQLTQQDTSNGNINGTSVQFAIDVQTDGGGFVTKVTDTISGKTTSKYERSYRIELTGDGPWDVRIRRITADSTSSALQNKTFWESYTELIDAKLRYPNSAIVGLKVDASQFSSIPSRAYDVKLLKIKVPTNYNPDTRVYTGIWDGTFKVAWTDNPAWCFYDLLTNDRYGLGGLIDEAQVDKWTLYSVGRYCDELVPDGFGDYEPRFTCNIYLQSRAEAYRVIQDMASIFRGMVYWQSGAITVSQDSPSDPVYLFTPSNVIDGQFTYSGSSAKARHTVALVTWNDPDDFYRQKVEYVEDPDGITRYGIIQNEIIAVGCTSRGQANRVGRWLLYSEQSESDVVVFKTGIEGTTVRPGQVIQVADPTRAGARRGGRIVTATLSTVALDDPVLLSGAGHTISVILPNGTVEERAIASITGSQVTTVTNFSTIPSAGSIWVIQSPDLEAQTFRVISAVETDDGVEINALAHNPDKYAAIENNLIIQPRQISSLQEKPSPPTDGTVTEYLYQALTDVKVMAILGWKAPSNLSFVSGYEVSYKIGDGNYTTVSTAVAGLQITDAIPGDYTVSVKTVNVAGIKSVPYVFVASILGKSARPADITGLQMTAQNDTGVLQWDLHPDLDVRIGGKISVRYSEMLDGARWASAIPVADFHGGTATGSVPLRSGTYLVKAVDSSGNNSANATSIITDAANLIQFNAVASSTQEPSFSGTKTGLISVNGRLILDNYTYVDDISDFDEYTETLDEGLVEFGEYEFDDYIDTGAVYTSRVTSTFNILTYGVNNLVDQWGFIDGLTGIDEGIYVPDLVDSWEDWDIIINFDYSTDTDDSNIQLFISTTNDNPAGTPTWSSWRTFYVGDYTARAFRFKAKLIRGIDTSKQVALTKLGVVVDVPDRVESDNNILVPSTGMDVVFANAFFATPAVAITAENMATGDFAQITAKSPTGFTIQFKNSAGTGVARTMDWIAKGFGYQN